MRARIGLYGLLIAAAGGALGEVVQISSELLRDGAGVFAASGVTGGMLRASRRC